MASGKEIRFGVEGRAAMLRGVDLMADAVQVRERESRVVLVGRICRSMLRMYPCTTSRGR
jgi:hypothetical protein